MEIVSLREIPLQKWIQFVDESDECWLFHRPEAQNILDQSFQGFGLLESKNLVGLCILYSSRILGMRILTYRFGPAGLALNTEFQKTEVYDQVGKYLLSLSRQTRCSAINLVLPLCAPANLEKKFAQSHLTKLGFKEGFPWGESTKLIRSYTTLVDLTKPSKLIYKEFSRSSKRKCKRASTLNLQSKIIFNEVNELDWKNFVSNHRATFHRSGAPAYNNAMLLWLKNLICVGLAHLINFYKDNQCIASLLLLTYKKRAFCFASGVQSNHYETGVTAYIHWYAMEHLAKNGYHFYEMGYSFRDLNDQSKLYKLGRFKSLFGGSKIPTLTGTLVISQIGYLLGFVMPRIAKNFIQPVWRRVTHG